ncbi:hypothetical protein NQ317_019717 [Molorchus minor]|uniref:6-phosphofructokinase n=1 Tax=Molorchus minor TaxID=1323400 RepID=A0ABQ9JP37_9CUCU|nr:hypothetical protein NQ317_019717 [Molorchus minor]
MSLDIEITLLAVFQCAASFCGFPPNMLAMVRLSGHRLNIIIVSEGATNRNCEPITCEQIKKDNLGQDTRVTVLGHIQRGGNPSAFDRILGVPSNLKSSFFLSVRFFPLTKTAGIYRRQGAAQCKGRIQVSCIAGCRKRGPNFIFIDGDRNKVAKGSRMGAEAVMALMEADDNSESCVISLDGNEAIRLPLMDCVNKTQAVAKAMADKQWDKAVELRGRAFKRNLDTFRKLTRLKLTTDRGKEGYTMGVMHIGSPACGMNAAVRSFLRNSIYRGNTVMGIHDGIDGLISGRVREMVWSEVTGWVYSGGAFLGTKRTLPGDRLELVASKLQQFKIQALLIIGGFEVLKTTKGIHNTGSSTKCYNRQTIFPKILSPSVNPATPRERRVQAHIELAELVEILARLLVMRKSDTHWLFVALWEQELKDPVTGLDHKGLQEADPYRLLSKCKIRPPPDYLCAPDASNEPTDINPQPKEGE